MADDRRRVDRRRHRRPRSRARRAPGGDRRLRADGTRARPHGLRRRPSETPLEYLRRILLGLTASADAVSRLTGLFEQAKFSRHEIDAPMKQDAIGALREIRDDLRWRRA